MPGFPTTDLQHILQSTFSLRQKVVGFRDSRNIYYTLSTVCRAPANFSRVENKLSLILELPVGDGSKNCDGEIQSYKYIDYEDSEGTIQTDEMAERVFRLMDDDGYVSCIINDAHINF